jgi:hypothetical protein
MRSPRAVAAAAIVILAVVAAIGLGVAIGGSAAEFIVHFGVGAGFVLLATAAFDFGVPRWAAWVGALSAGAFGSIFLLQGLSDLVPGVTVLHQVAFDTLGHEPERVLPDVVYVWFMAVLLFASTGRSRIMGWIVMGTVIGVEVASAVALVLGVGFPTIKILLFLPFVWLLVEGLKSGRKSVLSSVAQRETEMSGALAR